MSRTVRSASCAADASDVCPENCIQLVPLESIQFTPEVLEEIRANSASLRVELARRGGRRAGSYHRSAMLKDETRCIRCGLCAERCPVSVITMEAYSMRGAQ